MNQHQRSDPSFPDQHEKGVKKPKEDPKEGCLLFQCHPPRQQKMIVKAKIMEEGWGRVAE